MTADAQPRPAPFPAEATDYEALARGLDEATAAAQRLIAQMDRNLFLLRDCHVEADAAREILANSNRA